MAADGRDGIAYPQPKGNPALDNGYKLFAAILEALARCPYSGKIRDMCVIGLRLFVFHYFIFGPFQSGGDVFGGSVES